MEEEQVGTVFVTVLYQMHWRFIRLLRNICQWVVIWWIFFFFFFILRDLFYISVCCGFPHPQIYFSVAERKQEGGKKQASSQKQI